jgi:enoyl-CoA hydratase/carnithine racemase
VIGFSKASELVFTGDSINAEEALACGLVSKVVPDEHLMEEVHALAQRIAINPGHALRMTKRLLREAQRVELTTSLEMAAGMQALAHGTSDHKEAVAAFLEKRTPRFTGE